MFTQADHYEDYEIESNADLATLAKKLAHEGFMGNDKWIMPGAIVWVKQL